MISSGPTDIAIFVKMPPQIAGAAPATRRWQSDEAGAGKLLVQEGQDADHEEELDAHEQEPTLMPERMGIASGNQASRQAEKASANWRGC